MYYLPHELARGLASKYFPMFKEMSEEVLRDQLPDASTTVRLALAMWKHSPPEILGRLATDPDETVRHTALDNPNLPNWVLAMAQLAAS
jgi:hypothetical protein